MKRVGLIVQEETIEYSQITTSKGVYDMVAHLYDNLPYEKVIVIYLNNANIPLYIEDPHTIGSDTGSIIDVKRICKTALDTYCKGVIMIHNHPSGNLRPSQADLTITTKLSKALMLFDIELLDSIIVGKNDYYSLRDEGKL